MTAVSCNATSRNVRLYRTRPCAIRGMDFLRAGIKLSVEPLNRFECHGLNTLADTTEIVARVDEPNSGMLYDTFWAMA